MYLGVHYLHVFFLREDRSLPIQGMKLLVVRNLRKLEREGMVSSTNDYQEIINAIAKVYTCRYNIALSGCLEAYFLFPCT